MWVISKNNLESLARDLSQKSPVFVPSKREDGQHVFCAIDEESKPDFEYSTTLLSAKTFFFPPKEETFVFDNKKKKILSSQGVEKFILFGLNLRDTEALAQLDEIMKRPNQDYFYFQKRNSSVVVSIINVADPLPHVGIDLILEKINEKEYKALPLSDEGRKILTNRFFVKKEKIKAKPNPESLKMPKLRKLLLDSELLKDAVEWSWKGMPEFWDELGERCLGCGICTYVCPLCYCFSVEDRCALDGKRCSKTREWDACTLPGFAQITGALPTGGQGHNFHKTVKERYYNWYYHKFVRGYKEYGKSQCVACGRCQQYCPAGIDMEKVLVEIVNQYQKLKIKN